MNRDERRALRQQLGSQRAVAARLGITDRSIKRFEAAKDAPRWYEVALKGLALAEKQNPPAGG